MRAARSCARGHFLPHCSAYHLAGSDKKWPPAAALPLQVTNFLPAARDNCREAAEVGVAATVDGCEATDNHRPCPFHAPSGAACGRQLAPELRDLARRCRPRGWTCAATWGGATSGGCECRRALPWVGFWNGCSILIFLMAYALCYIPHSACMFVLRTVRAFTLYDKATRPSHLC